jgi:hypothetical protein
VSIISAIYTLDILIHVDLANGTIYSSGTSTATFEALPDSPSVTIPMIGRFDIVTDGPESGKISKMYIYKDRVPFLPYIQKLPGMSK